MSDEALIRALSAGLRPVRRLRSPAVRAAAWVLAVAVLAGGLTLVANMPEVEARMQAPDLRWAMVGAVATAMLAALAAFEMSVPGRSAWWVLAPLPTMALWLVASGWGCLRDWDWPGLVPATMHDAMGCVTFITMVSVPLSGVLFWMLHRACPLWPARVAGMAGLAAAAAAASLLTLFHPHDASAVDMLMHLAAVAVVVGVCRLLARLAL